MSSRLEKRFSFVSTGSTSTFKNKTRNVENSKSLLMTQQDDLKSTSSFQTTGSQYMTKSFHKSGKSVELGSFYYDEDALCIACNEKKVIYKNFVQLCYNCLCNELKVALIPRYLEYNKIANEFLKKGKFSEVNQCFENRFNGENSKQILLRNKIFNLSDIQKITGTNLQVHIDHIKTDYCNICQKESKKIQLNENSKLSQVYITPCECFTCSKACFNTYFEFLLTNSNKSKIVCSCNHVYSVKDLIVVYTQFYQNSFFLKKHISTFLTDKFHNYCYNCNQFIELSSKKGLERMVFQYYIENSDLENIIKKVYHLTCLDCYNEKRIKKETTIDCEICLDKHFITNLQPINGYDLLPKKESETEEKDECLIF